MTTLRHVTRSWKTLKNASVGSEESLAYKVLLTYTTYRLTAEEARDRLIGFRVLYRTLRLMLSESTGTHTVLSADGATNACVLGLNNGKDHNRARYIGNHADACPKWSVYRELTPRCLSRRPGSIMPFFFLGIRLALACFLSKKHRGNKALVICFLAEIAGTIDLLKSLQVDTVYEWDPYLLNSNWQALLFESFGIRVIKLPSSGPLTAHHQIMLSDVVVLSTPYQEEELNLYAESISVKTILRWPPEGTEVFAGQYLDPQRTEKTSVLGFYSHGSWLRKKAKHSDDGLNIAESESEILDWLNRLLRDRKDIELVIFCHPREKQQQRRAETQAFYTDKLGTSSNWRIMDWSVASHDCFDACHIGIAAYSTIIYTRMYCGFPTLIRRSEASNFPFKASSLWPISFGEEHEMLQLLEQSLSLDREAFFNHFNVQHYRLGQLNDLNSLEDKTS